MNKIYFKSMAHPQFMLSTLYIYVYMYNFNSSFPFLHNSNIAYKKKSTMRKVSKMCKTESDTYIGFYILVCHLVGAKL